MYREFSTPELIYLLKAARWTIALCLIAFAGGGILGLVVALLRVVPVRLFNYLAAAYIQVFRGTPLLMQLFLAYFGLGILGFDVPPLAAASVALVLHTAAYLGEIWRGCIEAIPKGQWEASESMGLTFAQQMRWVILPQAAKISLPPTVGFLVSLVKGTSLTSIIGYIELTRAGQIVNNITFQPFLVFGVVAAIYFAICFPLSVWSRRLERRPGANGAVGAGQ